MTARSFVDVSAPGLVAQADELLRRGFRLALVAAHDDGDQLRVVYDVTKGPPVERVEVCVRLSPRKPELPSLAALSFPASRFEREMRDLFGIEPIGHPQPRRLVLHQHWPEGWRAMRRGSGDPPSLLDDAAPYPFVPVEGNGVYEIPVGPVHAGLIEPGHFRFFVIGETILRMKARLWFVHKGIERLLEGKTVAQGLAIAERVSGDTAVGHSLAYCLAVEEAEGLSVPVEATRLRAALLELERLYNHVGDIGALANDVGFGLAQARALDLRERLLRLNAQITGHRLLRGGVVPGGAVVARLPSASELDEIDERLASLTRLVMSNPIVVDRFTGTAVLSANDALDLGTVGVTARASGSTLDAREAHPFAELSSSWRISREEGGDVLSRFNVRRKEAEVSIDILREWESLDVGEFVNADGRRQPPTGSGLGIVEAWRGSLAHRVEVDDAGTLRRVKIVDPSFLNWPALPVSLADTIVPDFPLANKSFNLSYAGNDL
ncbi:MAG: NADH-quinone oxidoreductase subunit C [Acidimicrobiales bacterium]